MKFIGLDSGDVKQIHSDDNENHTLHRNLVKSNGQMYATCARHRKMYTLSLDDNDKVVTPFCGDAGSVKRFSLTTNASIVLP